MLKRIKNTQIGDVFSVPINEKEKRYIQYIISDKSQLNSDVIRAFKKVYMASEEPSIEDIVKDEVDFYAHCVTKAGIKQGYWVKVGNSSDVGNVVDIVFSGKEDDTLAAKDEDDWYIWTINGDRKKINKIVIKTMKTYHGYIVSPLDILIKLKTGKYRGVYANR